MCIEISEKRATLTELTMKNVRVHVGGCKQSAEAGVGGGSVLGSSASCRSCSRRRLSPCTSHMHTHLISVHSLCVYMHFHVGHDLASHLCVRGQDCACICIHCACKSMWLTYVNSLCMYIHSLFMCIHMDVHTHTFIMLGQLA